MKPGNIVGGLLVAGWIAGWSGLLAYNFAEPKMLVEPVVFEAYTCPAAPGDPFGSICDSWVGIPGLDPNWKKG
jgi:hypothetical protein